MKPLALDLCCGKGGWTNGLLAAGWDVIGVDIEDMGGYQGHLVFADVREIAKDVQAYFPAIKFDLVVASPPCQEFSVSSQPFKKSREKFNLDNPPDRSIWNACVKIASDLEAPLILENVRGAVKFMGHQTWHYGSYYFWGQMPALIPIPWFDEAKGKWSHRKGFGRAKTKNTNPSDSYGAFGGSAEGVKKMSKFAGEYERVNGGVKQFARGDSQFSSSHSKRRKEWSATVAMIPLELSTWIGQCFYPREVIPSKKEAE